MLQKKIVCMATALLLVSAVLTGCSEGTTSDSAAQGSGTGEAASSTAQTSGGQKTQYMFATGSQGGVYSLIGGGMAKCINEIYPEVEVIATVPTSTSQSPSMLDQGQISMAVGMADMVMRGRQGVEEYENAALSDNVVELCAMYDNGMGYVVLDSTRITSIHDVEGKKFSVASEATRQQTAAVVAAAGLDPDKVNWQVMPYQQAAEALMDGTIDIMSLTSIPRNSLVDQIAMKGYRWVEIDEETRNNYNRDNPLWTMLEIPPDTYPDQPESAWGPAYYTVLYGNMDIPEEHAYNMVKAMMENNHIIEEVYSAGSELNIETTRRYIELGIIEPENFHPGAARYFREQGVIS